jgi:MFS family permease
MATASPKHLADGLGPVPLYQSETAPKWIRGFIVSAYQWAITIGLLLAALVNNATANRDDSGSYRIPIAVQLAWSLILFFGMVFLPETPRFLIKKDNADKAALALSRLRRLPVDHEAIAAELAEVRATHEFEMTLGKGSYMDCLRPPILKRQLTGMGLQALQQLTG